MARERPRFVRKPIGLRRSASLNRSHRVERTTVSRSPLTVRRASGAVELYPLGFAPNPYEDYLRLLTPEGGIAFFYKDLDQRFRHTLRALLLWSGATGLEAWLLLLHSPVHRQWINAACLLAAAIVNVLIVSKPVECYRKVEFRPDCMIIGDRDVFWLAFMDAGLPSFHAASAGILQFSGIYGARAVDYFFIRRFDPCDRTPEVLAAHLHDAMNQLWNRPL